MNWRPWKAIFRETMMRTPQIIRVCLLGLTVGAISVAFQFLVHGLFDLTIHPLSHESLPVFAISTLLILITVSLISQWLLVKIAPEAAGSGIPQTKTAYWTDFGHIPIKVAWVKLVAGTLSIGGGMSLGREGPSVQIGAAVSSTLAGWMGVAKQKRREYCAAGAAAGLAAAFNTPLAAITFVLEEILGTVSSRALGGVVLASVMGAFAVLAIRGPFPAFQIPEVFHPSWIAFGLTPVVAVLASLVAVSFQRMAIGLRGYCKRSGTNLWWVRALVGALSCWLLGVGVFYLVGRLGVFSMGYEDLSEAIVGELALEVTCLLLLGKLLATAAAYGTGGCGGIFAPSLFFGAMTGMLVADVTALVIGDIAIGDRQALVLAGMSACLAGLVRAPLTSILILFEMTRNFAVVPGLMLGVMISQALATRLLPRSFYEALLEQDNIRLQHLMAPSDLRRWREIPVALVAGMEPIALESSQPAAIDALLEKTTYRRIPVLDDGKLQGVATRPELEAAASTGRPPKLRKAIWVQPDAKVGDAEALFIKSELDFLCVGDKKTKKLVGVLTLHDLLRARLEE